MSYDLGIHVWYESEIDRRPSLFAKAAVSVPGLTTGKLTVADTDPSEIVLDLQLQASDEQTIQKALRPFLGENFAYQFERTFECRVEAGTTDGTTMEPRPLSIHLCGSGYGVDGYYLKRNGLLRLSFSTARVFSIPTKLLERARTLPPGSIEQIQALRAIGAISHNIDVVHSTAEGIILGTDPTHLMVCTEWEVHPLTAHAMYHRDLTEFGKDLCRIVSMSEQGGLYLQAPEETGMYADPRKVTLEYGYLRNATASAEFASRVEMLKGKVVNAGLLPEDRVKEVLMTAPGTEIRQLRQGLYIATGEGACSYLEGPFFDLATAVPDAQSGYTQ